MKVKFICCKCGERHYSSEWNLKDARKTKRNYKKGRFTCSKCGGFSGCYSIGMLTWNNQECDKY